MDILPARGAFGTAANELHKHGLIVLPVGADKSPLVKGFTKWRGQSRATVNHLVSRHGDANVGILTGRGQTVVDADDERTLADAESRFGKTPLVTRSPRGGGHLYFKSAGERCANLRRFDLNIDIKGRGGYVLAPPSCRPDGAAYRLERGTWDDLRNLPQIAPGAIPEPLPSRAHQNAPQATRTRPGADSGVPEGSRNTYLFDQLRQYAPTCPTADALAVHGRILNATCRPPLPDREVERTVRQVWGYKQAGRLLVPGRQLMFMSPAELELLGGNGDATLLLMTLRQHHGGRQEPFAVSCKAMEAANVICDWGVKRYRAALHALVELRLLSPVHHGGRFKGDASQFRMGSPKAPNVMNIPSAPSPWGWQ